MKLGLCGGAEHIEVVKKLGFDYMEMAASTIEAMNEQEFAALAVANQAARCESFEGIKTSNGMFPGTLVLVGPARDERAIEDYLDILMPRLAQLGVERLVFGSGGARRVPEGFDRAEAWAQLVATARFAAKKAEPYGIRIGMEHLNGAETNILTSFAETAVFAREADVGVTLDFYHLLRECEGADELKQAAQVVWHCHTCGSDRAGLADRDFFFLSAQKRALEAIGYTGRISLEAALKEYETDAAASLAVLRKVWN